MKYTYVQKAIKSTASGRFVRIDYTTEVKPAAAHKDLKITKEVQMTVRLGCQYSHIADVIKRREENPPKEYKAWWKWVPGYEHYIKEALSSGVKYLNVQTSKIPNQKIVYKINDDVVDVESVKAVTPPSYWNKTAVDTFDIKIENITRIGDITDEEGGED